MVLGVTELIQNSELTEELKSELNKFIDELKKCELVNSTKAVYKPSTDESSYSSFVRDFANKDISYHEARPHMDSDLLRYFFCSVYRKVYGKNAKSDNFPSFLAPAHKNWNSGKFVDRFKVQSFDQPSSTVTSHISKDGHYFIHDDPTQCRSLTVREAARLQSFPDSYHFIGKRTNQYHQVGNAVPPYLARQIAHIVAGLV